MRDVMAGGFGAAALFVAHGGTDIGWWFLASVLLLAVAMALSDNRKRSMRRADRQEPGQ